MLIANNYTTLGFVHLRRAQASKDASVKKSEAEIAIAPFRKALESCPLTISLYMVWDSVTQILNNYPAAEGNLAKAVAVNGIVMASARNLLEEIYKSQHKQSLTGLDQVIARAKAEIELSLNIKSWE